MKSKTTEEYFDGIIAEAMKIGIEKMSIYGTSWTSYRPPSLLTRMLNKGKRVVTLQQTKENKVGEKISEGFNEIMNYAVLLGIMIEHKVPLYSDLPPGDVTKYRQAIFKKAKEIMINKNHDYGEAWRQMTQEEMIDEINVKIQRMKKVFEIKNEVSVDNIYDVINYCAFAIILFEEKIYVDI